MSAVEKTALVDQITELGDRAAAGSGIEVVEIQLKGAGKARLLRVYIDKQGGVTHSDCELISQRLGKLLDDEDVMPEDSYTLEVSSPGVERKLTKPRDFERVVGQRIRIALREPVDGQLRFEGKLSQIADGVLEVEMAPDQRVHIRLDRVQKANLKFDW
jgi:ribosome maturation factor RimP